MDINRAQLRDQYKKMISLMENLTPSQTSCKDHCVIRDSLELLIKAKYLDYLREDELEKEREQYRTQVKIAIAGSTIAFLFSLIILAIELSK